MKYRLISKGRLLDGVDRAQVLARLSRATRMSAAQVEKDLLSGTRTTLVSSTDNDKLTRLHRVLRDAGLDVEMRSEPDASPEKPAHEQRACSEGPSTPPPARRPPSSWSRWTLASLVFLVLCVAGLAAYAWHWLNRPLPPQVLAAESALFDDGLVAVGLIDVEKLLTLKRYWFGDLDPAALPVDEDKRDLVETLFDGPARFQENLQQVVFSLSVPLGQEGPRTVMLLSGRFDHTSLTRALSTAYDVDKIDDDLWSVTEKKEAPAEPLCENEQKNEKEPTTFYVQVSPRWIMVVDDRAYVDEVWARLRSESATHHHAERWRDYRRSRLASFMVLVPDKAGEAIGGMPGMLAHQAASEAPQVTYVAAGIGLEPLQGGLNANIHLATEDAAWNAEAETKIRRELDTMAKDSRSFSPTLAGLVDRVAVQGQSGALDIDVRLDTQLLNDMGQVVREGIASVFSVGMSSPNGDGKVPPERIDENPRTYANLDLGELPPFHDKFKSEPPLFSKGAFAVDFNSIKPNDEGLLEIWLEGKVGLPEHNDQRFNEVGELSMTVTKIQDTEGNDLLRDERCVSRNDLFGRSPNHEAETNANHHQDHGWVWKHVRLKPEVSVEKIHRIEGRLGFSMPTGVRRFEIPLQAGQVVEHAGLRFYLSNVKTDSVSYQATGETDRLLEVRGLNKDRRALHQGWKMGMDNGQAPQTYAGQVHALEIYVAEHHLERETAFELTDLFRASEEDDEKKSPKWLAPERIDRKLWDDYAALDLSGLTVDPRKDWHIWNKDVTTIAESSWSPIKMYVTHTPQQWGNNPMAHLYFPQFLDLPGVLSAISYRIDHPAPETEAGAHYHQASYPYYTNSGEVVVNQELDGKPMALNSFPLKTGLADNQKLDRLEGEIIIRLPQHTRSTHLALDELWQGRSVDGVKVSVTEVSRGIFPGYGLKIEGEIEKLVNLHGLTPTGEPVIASPVNFQDSGYWTMTLPFGKGIEEVELVTAIEQEVMRYPFDFVARYPAK